MTEVQSTRATTWRRLARWAAITAIVEYVIVMVAAKSLIPPIVVILLVLLAAVVLMRRPPPAGRTVALVGLVLFLASDVIFGGNGFSTPRSFPSFAIALAGLITGVVGITAAVAARRDKMGRAAPLTMAWIAAGLILAVTAGNILASVTYADATRQPGDVALTARNTKFGPSQLTVNAGRVTFFINNKDLQLHNFHIKGVGSAVLLPASHSVRRSFSLQPGTYTFVCDFHTPGMKGTLTVK